MSDRFFVPGMEASMCRHDFEQFLKSCESLLYEYELKRKFFRYVDWNGPTMPGMDTHCWLWSGQTNKKRYGVISAYGKKNRVNIYVYKTFVGPIPEGMLVCHYCNNTKCVRSDHMYLGTNKDNMRHKRLSDRSGFRLNIAKANEIKERLKCGESRADLQREFGISPTTMYKLAHGFIWGWTDEVTNKDGVN